jgi:hypothetical protein
VTPSRRSPGLDKAIATGAVANLYPDYEDVPRIGRGHRGDDARPEVHQFRRVRAVEKNMDYRFLEAATGKPKSALGY